MPSLTRPLALLGAVAVAAACTSSRGVAQSKPVAERATHLRSLLPSGFSASGRVVTPHAPLVLKVTPVASANPADFVIAPLPDIKTLNSVLAAEVNEPVPLTVYGLFVNSPRVAPGKTVTAVAAHLSPGPHHAALFILSGPGGYRAQHLVAVGNQVAAGAVTLPAHMEPGPWYLIVEDSAGVTSPSPGKLAGTVLVDVGKLTVAS